jgi:hypothetical protein
LESGGVEGRLTATMMFCCVGKIEQSVVGKTKIAHALLIDSGIMTTIVVVTITIQTIATTVENGEEAYILYSGRTL